MKNNLTVEWAPFKLKDGITEAQLLSTSKKFQEEFLDRQQGVISRDLVKKNDREFVDIVYWESREDADLAVKNADGNQPCYDYLAMMDAPDLETIFKSVIYAEVIESYA